MASIVMNMLRSKEVFKRKYKRSEWFEGLLFAESCIQDGMAYDDDLMFWNKDKSEAFGFVQSKIEENWGIYDYIVYYEENLE